MSKVKIPQSSIKQYKKRKRNRKKSRVRSLRIKSKFWNWVYNDHPDPQYAVMVYSYNKNTANITRKTRWIKKEN
jgi:hypothetical protein